MSNVDCINKAIKEIACSGGWDSEQNQALVALLQTQLLHAIYSENSSPADLVPSGAVDGTALTGTFQSIFNATNQAFKIVIILNNTDVDIWVTDVEGGESLYLPGKTSLTLDLASNNRVLNKELFVKHAGVVGTEGKVIISGVI